MKKQKVLSKLLTSVVCLALAAGTILSVGAQSKQPQDFAQTISSRFKNVEMDYKPEARWWLAEGSHTDQTLIESIHELYDSGFGALEFVTLDESVYLDDATYAWGSEEWIHDSHLIVEECTKLGMGVSFTSGTNWATANLVNITPDDQTASQELGYKTIDLAGGEHYFGELPKVKLPEGATKMRLENVIVAKSEGKADDGASLLNEDSLTDITNLAIQDENGIWNIDYTAPADGNYTVFVFWQYGTAENYKPSIGKSYTINYLTKDGANALIDYWEENILTEDLREQIKKNGDVSLYMDSLELRTKGQDTAGQLWSEDYLREFEKRRGYDLTKYLPLIIANRTPIPEYKYEVDSENRDNGLTEKIRRDTYQTNTELYMENCLEPIREWLHTFGMTLRAETSYGQLFELSQPIKSVDYVETESLEFFCELDRFRGQAGGAHLYDKLYSSETGAIFSGNYLYNNDYFRQIFYTQFAAGVQRTVVHGYSSEYGPEQNVKWPGYEGMGAVFSERFNRRQPNSIDYPEFNAHVARTQKVLRQGSIQMDLGILRNEYMMDCSYWNATDSYDTNHLRQHKGIYWKDTTLQDAGYTYDYFSPNLLQDQDITYSNGVVQADSAAYQALIVFEEEMPYESAQTLLKWAESGLAVVLVDGPTEEDVHPDITKYNESAAITTGYNDGKDEQLKRTMAQMRALDNVASVQTQEQAYDALIGLGVHPRAEYAENDQQNLLSVLRKDDDATYLYLYNYMYTDAENYQGKVSVDGIYKPYVLDTWTGEVTETGVYAYEDGRTILNVDLGPGDIMVFVLDPNGADESQTTVVGASENVYQVTDSSIYVTQSGITTLSYSDGTTYQVEVQAPENITLGNWDLTIEDWKPGEKITRTEDRGLGYTTTEATYTTKKESIHVGQTDLIPWKDIEAVGPYVSGVGTYRNTFTLPEDWVSEQSGLVFQADSVSGGTVALFINGNQVPINMDNTTVDISEFVVAGENNIEVRVTSSLRNRLMENGYRGWLIPVTSDNYGMVGNTSLITYTKVPVSKMQTDKGILNSVIAYAEQTKASGEYDNAIESVQKSFDAALENAKAVANNAAATQEEVDQVWMTLLNEIHKLGFVKGDIAFLECLVELAEGYDMNDYIEAGQMEFQEALAAAQAILADKENAMANEIGSAETNLLNAMLNLRFKADKSILEKVIAEANSKDANEYTIESYTALAAAVADANAVMVNENATQDEVDTAVTNVQAAMDRLVAVDGTAPTTENNVTQTGQESIIIKTNAVKTGDFSPITGLVAITLASAALLLIRKKK